MMPTQSSLSHRPAPIGDGTVGQTNSERDNRRDNDGTFSLKALANQRLERDPARDKLGTEASRSCPMPLNLVGRALPLEIDSAERAAICEFDGGMPREWAEGFAKLQSLTPPQSVSEQRWLQVIDDAGRFLDSWGPKLAALGWSIGEVFGVHPSRPELRRGGLIWHLRGRRVLAASKDSVTIETSNGPQQRIYRMAKDEHVHIWEIA